MFGDLFGEESSDSLPSNTSTSGKAGAGRGGGSVPPPERLSHGLCGIFNQGATCYLNSLLQTLALTPEFRKALFNINPLDLGCLADKDQPGAKVRVIPLHLQGLFARLLLLDVNAVKTDQLTDSFGWNNNEERDQHDVQELNRILFSAIEDSLVGTSGQGIISGLYHGTAVNQIRCEKCERISEREEDFLDLTVAVSGSESVEESLRMTYVSKELLDGANQYNCSHCHTHTNALKGARLRRLPPLLTISLLRFNFDFVKMERFKEIGKFKFPHLLDMKPYCDNSDGESNAEYELYAVVIHRGNTHGGHYHVYIRDIEGLASWTPPAETPICLPANPSTGRAEVIDPDSPYDLITAILRRCGNSPGLSINSLCEEIMKQTGYSWASRFKKKYGNIAQFLKRNDAFVFNPDSGWVSFVPTNAASPASIVQSDCKKGKGNRSSAARSRSVSHSSAASEHCDASSGRTDEKIVVSGSRHNSVSNDGSPSMQDSNKLNGPIKGLCAVDNLKISKGVKDCVEGIADISITQSNSTQTDHIESLNNANRTKRRSSANKSEADACVDGLTSGSQIGSGQVGSGQCWFDFDDAHVHPISVEDIERQFGGKESAYMLFYRSRALKKPSHEGDTKLDVPAWLQEEIAADNEKLHMLRALYETQINSVTVELHFSSAYTLRDGALHPRSGCYGDGSHGDASGGVSGSSLKLTVDRRHAVSKLLLSIHEQFADRLDSNENVLHIAKEVPAGLHLYDNLTADMDSSLVKYGVETSCQLFIWDGSKVDGHPIVPGFASEPILLAVSCPGSTHPRDQWSCGYAQNLTIGAVKRMICERALMNPDFSVLRRETDYGAVGATEAAELFYDAKTLNELGYKNCDQLLCLDLVDMDQPSDSSPDAKSPCNNQIASRSSRSARSRTLNVENRCGAMTSEGAWPNKEVEVTDDMSVGELRIVVLTSVAIRETVQFTRLRLDSHSCIVLPPLHEDESLSVVGIKDGSDLILEPGLPPSANQVTLFVSVIGSDGRVLSSRELTVDKDVKLADLLRLTVRTCVDPGGELVKTSGVLAGESFTQTKGIIEADGKVDNEIDDALVKIKEEDETKERKLNESNLDDLSSHETGQEETKQDGVVLSDSSSKPEEACSNGPKVVGAWGLEVNQLKGQNLEPSSGNKPVHQAGLKTEELDDSSIHWPRLGKPCSQQGTVLNDLDSEKCKAEDVEAQKEAEPEKEEAEEAVEGEWVNWHLRKTDFYGEPAEILDDLEANVADSGLKHGDVLSLQPGRIPPKGFLSLSIYLLPSLVDENQPQSRLVDQEENLDRVTDIPTLSSDAAADPLTPHDPPDPAPTKTESKLESSSRSMVALGSVVVPKQQSLLELKRDVLALRGLRQYSSALVPRCVRLRLLRAGAPPGAGAGGGRRPGAILRNHTHSLSKLKLASGVDIGVEILRDEEDLGASDMLLIVQLRLDADRSYTPPSELLWDLSQGATLQSLTNRISRLLGLDEDSIRVAKQLPEQFDWQPLSAEGRDQQQTPKSQQHQQNKKKKKKNKGGGGGSGGGAKFDLRHAPFFLQDGDVIGVKVRQDEADWNSRDFSTTVDEEGKRRVAAEKALQAERKRESRRRNAVVEGDEGGLLPCRRVERSIRIHVDDFR